MRIPESGTFFRGDSENHGPEADFGPQELEKPLNAMNPAFIPRISMRIPESCTVFRGDSENRGPEVDFQKIVG